VFSLIEKGAPAAVPAVVRQSAHPLTPESFEPARIERVYTGNGVHQRLAEELERLDIRRALLLTGKSLAMGNLIAIVRAAAGSRIAGDFAGVRAHNPTSGVLAASSAFESLNADGIVAFGGGSVVDCAKAVSWLSRSRGRDAMVPIVDLATALSGAEFACSFGQTDDETRVKGGWRDPSLYARAVFLDPMLTRETPTWLWYSTGFRAIDHAVESVLAGNAHPYVDALALQALQVFCGFPSALLRSHHFEDLQPGGEDGEEELRAACMMAAWMAHAGSYHIHWGLSHQMGRQLGPAFDIPHGHTSAILLPAVVELAAEAGGERVSLLEDAVELARGESFAGRLRWLAQQMRLPATLREAGVKDRRAVEQLFAGNATALTVIERVW
jgi:alcohol dehydrogenase class IV